MIGVFIAAVAGTGIFLWLLYKKESSGVAADAGVGDMISVPSSGKLSAQDLAHLAANAGFSGEDLIIAVAVALAESGGDTSAYNPEVKAGTPTGQGSFGLWQIYLKAHPEFQSWNLYDPHQNVVAAFRVYSNSGRSFSPWSTFQNGAYLAYVNNASLGVQNA